MKSAGSRVWRASPKYAEKVEKARKGWKISPTHQLNEGKSVSHRRKKQQIVNSGKCAIENRGAGVYMGMIDLFVLFLLFNETRGP